LLLQHLRYQNQRRQQALTVVSLLIVVGSSKLIGMRQQQGISKRLLCNEAVVVSVWSESIQWLSGKGRRKAFRFFPGKSSSFVLVIYASRKLFF